MKKILIITAILIFSLCNLSYAATVGLWTFDEASGNTAYDSSGYGNNGTIYGATRVPGQFGSGALNFDAIDDWVNIGDVSILDISSAISIESWMHSTAIMNDTIASKDDDLSNREYYLGLSYDQRPGKNGKIRWALNTSSFRVIDSQMTVNDGLWHHIVATYDGSYMRLYIDGVEDGNSEVSQTGLIPNTNAPFRIGYTGSANYQYFDGPIDEVAVYNRALTADEAYNHYNRSGSSPVPEPATMLLFSIGGIGMAFIKRRCKNINIKNKA